MKIRFKFTKTGRLKYIGHLDLLNVWGRALKASKTPVGYSKGFNPHMLVSFAAPLPLGIESLSEYVDVDIDDAAFESLPQKINARFPDGLRITGVYIPALPYKRVASVVTKAEYRLCTPYTITDERIGDFLASPSIEIMKKTKRTNEISDIRPDIFSIRKTGESELTAILSCGSAKNLKPTLFAEAFTRFSKEDEPIYGIKITRTEIFGENGFTPLSEV